MTSYTITVAPNDESDRYTTLVVDTSGGQVAITDVHLHAGGGMNGGQIPVVDFGLLLQAINLAPATSALTAPVEVAPITEHIDTAAATPATWPAPTPPAPDAQQPVQPVSDTAQGDVEAPATSPAAKDNRARKTARARNTARAGKAAADKAAAGKAPAKKAPAKTTAAKTTAAKATPAKATARKAAAAKKTAAKATGNVEGDRERVYRRMPDDFAEVYRQAGTVTGVADHYNVPRYTVNGWLRRHRATAAG
jgi:hypothetical protein